MREPQHGETKANTRDDNADGSVTKVLWPDPNGSQALRLAWWGPHEKHADANDDTHNHNCERREFFYRQHTLHDT
jgi:hypothetical protein